MKARAREDQLIVSYLLGLSSELEQNQIEARYFKDQRFYEHVLMLEEELICDYVSNHLSGEERRHFDQHFLQSDRRRKKFAATRSLMAYIADQEDWAISSKATNPSVIKTQAYSSNNLLDRLSDLLTPNFGLGWLAVTTSVLLFFGIALTRHVTSLRQAVAHTTEERLTLQQQEESLRGAAERQRAEAIAKRDEAASLTELIANGAPNLSTSMTQGKSASQPVTNLSLAMVRSAAPPTLVSLPRNTTTWQLALQLDPNLPVFTKYLIKLRTLESAAPLWQGEVLVDKQRLLVNIPTDTLKTGVYNLSLMGGNAAETDQFAGELFLRLVKE